MLLGCSSNLPDVESGRDFTGDTPTVRQGLEFLGSGGAVQVPHVEPILEGFLAERVEFELAAAGTVVAEKLVEHAVRVAHVERDRVDTRAPLFGAEELVEHPDPSENLMPYRENLFCSWRNFQRQRERASCHPKPFCL